MNVVHYSVQLNCKELVIRNHVMLLQLSHDISAVIQISKTTFSADVDIINLPLVTFESILSKIESLVFF